MMSEAEMNRLDLEDHAAHVTHLSPIEYAKLRGVKPQMVYYYIRQGKIDEERCVCGRKVVSIQKADATFAAATEARRKRSGQPVLEPATESEA